MSQRFSLTEMQIKFPGNGISHYSFRCRSVTSIISSEAANLTCWWLAHLHVLCTDTVFHCTNDMWVMLVSVYTTLQKFGIAATKAYFTTLDIQVFHAFRLLKVAFVYRCYFVWRVWQKSHVLHIENKTLYSGSTRLTAERAERDKEPQSNS